jgi:hypothetical protein
VKFEFAPPQRLLGVPLIVMPYAAVARQVDAVIAMNREGHLQAPSTEVSVRRLLEKLIADFPSESGNNPGESPEDSLEAELGLFGPIESVKFLGFVDHGIARGKSDSSDPLDPPPLASTRWEVYDVEQVRGSSVWLVVATASGSIQRIEVAVRKRS